MGILRREYWSGLPCPPPWDLPNSGMEPRSPKLHADFLPSESPGKPKNIGMSSLFLLQVNFPTHELNRGLLYCWRRQWHPPPALLPGKSHGWRSLVGCSPWGREESDMTEQLHFHFSLSCTGEGNGNPLQCSCLENPRDGGAWWAAVYGVAQSRTRLKRLSGSSSCIAGGFFTS